MPDIIMFSNNDKDSASKRNISQTSPASQQSSYKPKKLKTRQTYFKPSESTCFADDNELLRDTSISPSPAGKYQISSSSSDEGEHDDIGKSPYMIKPPLGNIIQ